MSKLGIHFPNAGFRNLDALWSVPWHSFCILHLNRVWVPEIRLRFPQARILVRAYSSNWTSTDPLEWAHEISEWATELRPFGIEITFANEQNLAAEGHPLGARPGANYPPVSVYKDILAWNTAVIRQLRAQIPWAVIHFPALSQGHSDDQADAGYVGFEILREAVQMCDVLDAHTYWDENQPGQQDDIHFGQRYQILHSLFPDKPIFVSEFGAMSSNSQQNGEGVVQWLEALPEYVSGACWFIWDSDAKNQSFVLRDKPSLAEGLRSYQVTASGESLMQSIVNPIDLAAILVAGWEDLNATAQAVPDGREIIGYGHLLQADDAIGRSISDSDARELLRRDLAADLGRLEHLVQAPLTANQTAALLSFFKDAKLDDLSGSLLLQSLNASDYASAALEMKRWRSSNDRLSPESVRRRQIESELFLRDVIPPDIRISPSPAAPPPMAWSVSANARWVSVNQGEQFQAIGAWYYYDEITGASADGKDDSGGAARSGQVLVKVEDTSGVGIPGQLVAHRWENPTGDCEPKLSDATGTAEFELGDDSTFNPGQTSGPHRIQVGDCVVAGLGIPFSATRPRGQTIYAIRVRKIA